MMMPPLLCVDAVSKRFGAAWAVRDASFTLEAGEILAVIGPSGCGKTTTLRMIAGFDPPDSGRISLSALDVTHLAPEQRGIGMVFQDYALFPQMTVAQNIRFGARDPSRLPQLLEMVGLADLANRYPDELSGGQQQRVALARSFAAQPRLILLDEPFSNLDPMLRSATRREIRQMLKSSGFSIVMVTHDQEEALSFADRVMVMQAGRVLQEGRAQDVYDAPRDVFVARFLGRTNVLEATARGHHCTTVLGHITLSEPASGRINVSLRPEMIRLTQTVDCTVGRIIAAEFKGHSLTYLIDVSGTEIQVDMPSLHRLDVGATVGVEVVGCGVPLAPSYTE